jgi:hypothetical protein
LYLTHESVPLRRDKPEYAQELGAESSLEVVVAAASDIVVVVDENGVVSGLSSAEVVAVVSQLSVVVVQAQAQVDDVADSSVEADEVSLVSAALSDVEVKKTNDVVTVSETVSVDEVVTSEEVRSISIGVVVEPSVVDHVVLTEEVAVAEVVVKLLEELGLAELIQSSQMLAPG